MKRRNFFVGIGALAAVSCARKEKSPARYDAKECPFCSTNSGVCHYCKGEKKCSFCGGSGKRTTVSPTLPEQGLKRTEYVEDCPYCKGSGACRYCDGVGKCWACKGTARIEEWDFYEKRGTAGGAQSPEKKD